jgi:hypothetical protein
MRPLSAIECISPAIARTKLILFAPFRKGRSWKLAATAHLSFMGCLFIPLPLAVFILPLIQTPIGTSKAEFDLVTMGVLAVMTVIFSVLFYIGARLEFALLDIVLFKANFVAPLWRKYRQHTWRWAGLKIAFATIISTFIGFPLYCWFAHSMSRFPMQSGQPASPELVGSFFLMWIFGMVWISFFLLCSSLLGDFVLPYIAIEDATLRNAVRSFAILIKEEPKQMTYFALLKVVFAIVGFIVQEVAALIVELVALIPLCLIGFIGWLLLHSFGVIGHALMVAGCVSLYLVGIVFVFYALIGIQGCVITFFQAYGLYFLSGRYPLLGDILEPPSTYVSPVTLPEDPIPPMPLENGQL